MSVRLRDQRAPMVREAYDDEDCHDFLSYELAYEIPTVFRYADGIHEVQKRLILRYGDENIARAMGVFKELLEVDDASGMGDDGDMWRSWRHDHKHRKEDLSNPGTPRFPGMILPSPISRSRRVTAMSPSCEDVQGSLRSPSTQGRGNAMPISSSVAADGLRQYPRNGNFPQPSEAAWLAQTYGGAPRDYEGEFESRVNKTNHSHNLPAPGEKQETLPMRRPSMRRMVAKHVSTIFHKEGKADNVKRKHGGLSRDNKDGARSRRPEIPPLSFDGAGDEPDLDNSCCTECMVINCTNASVSSYSHMVDNKSPVDTIDNVHYLHSVNLNRASPSPRHPIRRPLASTMSPRTSSTAYSKASFPQHSSISTAPSPSNRSTPSRVHEFRSTTRELITQPTLPGFSSGVQRAADPLDPLDPAKFDPGRFGTSREPGDVATRYMSIVNTNPFKSDRQTHWQEFIEDDIQPSVAAASNTPETMADDYNHKPNGMTHSQSENNVMFVVDPKPMNASRLNLSNHKHAISHSKLDERGFQPIPADRGRAPTRTPSPVKHLENFGGETMLDFPQSPSKRQRSPMKKMFGENGWLGRSTSMKELPSEQYRKTGLKHWGGKIKQRVEDLTGDVTKLLPNPFSHENNPGRRPIMTKFPISIDPPTQAKLYSEIELMICATANQYLMTQRREGRMSIESLIKITTFWASKGRPQVIEFQFDQATQRDLILYNLKTFRFYGEHAENPVSLNSMMYNWKTVAKEMSVRTFCTPDSVIRKHLHDIYQILEMLGAPIVTFLAFQAIQVKALKTMREEQEKRDEAELVQYGVEKVWNPPERVISSPRHGMGELEDCFEE